MSAITIRPAGHHDSEALRRLAALDDARPLRGEITVAEVAGQIHAALADDGRVVADPFRRTADLVELLRTHAAAASASRRARPRLIPVFAR